MGNEKNEKGVNFYNTRPRKLILDSNGLKFRPNLTPAQVLRRGAFGGTYFRDIESSVTGKKYTKAYKEFPKSWFAGLNIKKQITQPWSDKNYDTSVNKYGVKVGSTLEFWETKGWITEHDPYGWFQWYCRYYRGRRLDSNENNIKEDARQIGRFNAMARFVGPLVKSIKEKESEDPNGKSYVNDPTVAPKQRQILLHWGYELTQNDYERFKKKGSKITFE